MPHPNISLMPIKFIRAILLTLTLSASFASIAQTSSSLNSFPSPNAAGLGLYTDYPVSEFTGTPEISIPIYEINDGPLVYPLTLNYHPSAVRVHSRPGWLGMGWSLGGLGVITRTLNGKIDEYTFRQDSSDPGSGFYNTYAKLNGSDTDWQSTQRLNQYRDDYLPGNLTKLEAMPDEFNFSLMGYRGKFFMGHDGQWKVICDQDVKVEFNPAWGEGFLKLADLRPSIYDKVATASNVSGFSDRYFNKFTLVTPDGTKYEFGGVNATEYSVPFGQQGRAYPVPTSWYLTKVTRITGQTISFNFLPGELIANFSTQFFYSSTSRDVHNPFGVGLNADCSSSMGLHETDFDGTLIMPVYLSSIISRHHTINFQTTVSTQLRWPSNAIIDYAIGTCSAYNILPRYFVDICSGPTPFSGWGDQIQWRQLDRIQISDSRWQSPGVEYIMKKFELKYTNNPSTRLKLLEVSQKDLNDIALPSYKFEYNTTTLPSYSELRKIDHWDFYNGTTIFPTDMSNVSTFNTNFYAARDADAVGTFSRAEVLEKIIYPTAGYVKYEYEPNGFSKVVDRETATFPVQDLGQNKIAGGLRIKRITSYNSTADINPLLIKEYYYVRGYTMGANVSTLPSSGILTGYPKYYWPNYTAKSVDGQTFTYSIFSSGSLKPFGINADGSHIGYSEVVEVQKDANGSINGYSKYFFSNFDADIWGISHLDEVGVTNDPSRSTYSSYSSHEQQRGKPLKIEIFSATNQILKATSFKYSAYSNGYVRRVLQEPFDVCSSVTAGAQICYVTAFKEYSYKYNLIQKEEIDYAGTNEFNTVTTYDYNSNNLPRLVSVINSDGSMEEQVTKYPADYNIPANVTQLSEEAISVSGLINKHVLNVPIEVMHKKNGNLTSSGLVGYRSFGTNILPYRRWIVETTSTLPMGVVVGKTTGLESTLFNPSNIYLDLGNYYFAKDEHYDNRPDVYNSYNALGNLQELYSTNNIVTTYLWSYKNSLPVAEIKGATFTEVSSALTALSINYNTFLDSYPSSSDLINIMASLRTSLSHAQVTAFTYNAFGLTSKTDLSGVRTFYEYDTFGRLVTIKNFEGNIIQAFKYKYSSEQ